MPTRRPSKKSTKKSRELKPPQARARIEQRRRPVSKKRRTVRRTKSTTLIRTPENPIISPEKGHFWESSQTFNPGVVLLHDKIHFLYRAIGEDGLSRFGYAASHDGFTIDDRLPHPIFEHRVTTPSYNIFSFTSGGSWGGAEDPRIVRVGDEDTLYMTYTGCNGDLRVSLTSIKLNDFINKKWNWKTPLSLSPPDEIHKNWLIFPEKINGKYAMLLSIVPEIEIAYFDNLNFNGNDFVYSKRGFGMLKNTSARGCWDKWVRGPGPIPVKTKYGWLVLYHAMDNDWGKYKVGALLLDLHDPQKIIARAKDPILEPSAHYENNGFKAGVVYASGATVKDGTLFIYYGGADSYVCVATADLEEFLDALRRDARPTLTRRTLKKKT